jgi:outer membrane lipoprotein-sorting protein
MDDRRRLLPSVEPPADEIVRRADRVRTPEGGTALDLKITVLRDGAVEYVRGFEVFGKGNDKTLIRFTAPRSEAGKAMLLLGRDLWIYLPDVSKPVRIPLQERLVGDVSNGDLARANFAGAYRARSDGRETVGGKDCYVLELTALDDAVTYGRVRYWVGQGDFHPVQADFFTAAGRHLKRGFYEDYRSVLDEQRPMRLIFEDRVRRGRRSVLEYRNMRRMELPDRMFNKNYLGRH